MTEIEALREEVAQLRKLVFELATRQPTLFPVPAPWPPCPQPYYVPMPLPTFPFGPLYTTCAQAGAGNTAFTLSS